MIVTETFEIHSSLFILNKHAVVVLLIFHSVYLTFSLFIFVAEVHILENEAAHAVQDFLLVEGSKMMERKEALDSSNIITDVVAQIIVL